jgi:hypothetical protein
MANSKEYARSRGAVVFALNNGHTDYVAMADQTSRLIKHNLGLPVTLITDTDSCPAFEYDKVVRVDIEGHSFKLDNATVKWRNFGRHLVYDLSPYEETLLLDSDYAVFGDSLLKLFATDFDYRLMHHNVTDSGTLYEEMGETSLPFIWATVVAFKKTARTQLFFDLISRIQRNYHYYRALYNVREGNFRNDYAFAIANIIMSGYNINEEQGIPWAMYTLEKPVVSIKPANNFLHIRYADSATVVPYQDIHVMDKDYLLSDNFKQLVGAICES